MKWIKEHKAKQKAKTVSQPDLAIKAQETLDTLSAEVFGGKDVKVSKSPLLPLASSATEGDLHTLTAPGEPDQLMVFTGAGGWQSIPAVTIGDAGTYADGSATIVTGFEMLAKKVEELAQKQKELAAHVSAIEPIHGADGPPGIPGKNASEDPAFQDLKMALDKLKFDITGFNYLKGSLTNDKGEPITLNSISAKLVQLNDEIEALAAVSQQHTKLLSSTANALPMTLEVKQPTAKEVVAMLKDFGLFAKTVDVSSSYDQLPEVTIVFSINVHGKDGHAKTTELLSALQGWG